MTLNGLKCKCNCNDLFAIFGVGNPNHTGIYCLQCGSFIKWANKEEKRLIKATFNEKGDGLYD